MLFGSPVAGAGVGIDNIAFMSWFLYGGGKELYDQLWKEMGVNVKGFMLQPVGPEALGWFKEPINSMEDFRKYRFRTPPGIPGQTYNDIGVAAVAMGGGDILPALEKGTIDAAEWCCPKPDSVFGFQKVLKHYYLQGLHQVVVNADIYINGDVYDSLTDHQKKALEVAANASLTKALAYRIYENGKALKDLTENHGVQLHDTPTDYFSEYMNAAKASLEKNAEENAFFKEVWDSQRAFAEIAVPFWAGAQTSNANLGQAFAKSRAVTRILPIEKHGVGHRVAEDVLPPHDDCRSDSSHRRGFDSDRRCMWRLSRERAHLARLSNREPSAGYPSRASNGWCP